MSAIITKFRPLSFDDVIGQPVIKSIKDKCVSGNIPNAFLFSGMGGSGKTTTARLVAMTLNSAKLLDDGSPDLTDANVQAVIKGMNPNVIELDMASNRGIDDIRDIQKYLQFVPTNGGYRVIILDEAHQITATGAAALLKVLEEPPAKNLFILCTTDPQKLLPTIRTRCVSYEFKQVSNDEIAKRLKFICSDMGTPYDDDAISIISSNCGGSVRDAESILDSCILDGEVKESIAKIQVSNSSMFPILLMAIKSGDYTKVLSFFSSSDITFTDSWYDKFSDFVLNLMLKGEQIGVLSNLLYRHRVYITSNSVKSQIVFVLLDIAKSYIDTIKVGAPVKS